MQQMANTTPKKKREALPGLIEKHRGNVSAISRVLKQPRSTIHKLISDDPVLARLLADERERMIDNAEEGLNSAVDKGEAWAVCFTLKTQGKERGYTERSEVTGKDGVDLMPPKVIVEIVSNDRKRKPNTN